MQVGEAIITGNAVNHPGDKKPKNAVARAHNEKGKKGAEKRIDKERPPAEAVGKPAQDGNGQKLHDGKAGDNNAGNQRIAAVVNGQDGKSGKNNAVA